MTTTATHAFVGPLTANGVTPIPFSFQALSAAEIEVKRAGVVVLPSTYTVTLNGDGTGSITPLASWGADAVIITSLPSYQQPTNFTRFAPLYPDEINPPLDRLARAILALKRRTEVISGGNDTLLRDDLASLTGGGLVSFLSSATYAANTVGAFLKSLVASAGSSVIGFIQAGTGAVARWVQDKLRDNVSLFDFMTTAEIADYQGRTFALDHTTAFNTARAAVSASGGARKLALPAGILNLTGTITHVGPLEIDGVGHSGESTTATSAANQGTLIRFGHTGVGFNVTGGALSVRNLGWFRPQAAPGGGWTPYASDWDFQLSATDSLFENVLIWGSKKGIVLNAGGRLRIKGLLGQCFDSGIKVVQATDKCVFDDIHLWPVWSQNANVKTYMLANYIATELQRCDNPMVANLFTIWARKGMSLSQGAAGSTRKLKAVNVDFDEGSAGLQVESGTSGVTAQFSNFSHISVSAASNGCGVQLNGTDAIINISGFASTGSNISAIRNEDGTTNRLTVSGLYMTQWNQANGGFQGATVAGSGNELGILGKAVLGTAAAGSTAPFGGAGIKQGLWARVAASGTTGVAGLISFAHGLGYAPGDAEVSLSGSNNHLCNVVSIDATNVNCIVYSGASTVNSTAVSGSMRLYY